MRGDGISSRLSSDSDESSDLAISVSSCLRGDGWRAVAVVGLRRTWNGLVACEVDGWCPLMGDLGGMGRNRAGLCSSANSSSDAAPISASSPAISLILSFALALPPLTGLLPLRASFAGRSAPSCPLQSASLEGPAAADAS